MELHWNMTAARVVSKTPALRWRFFVLLRRKIIVPVRWYGIRCDQLTWDIYWFQLLFPVPVGTTHPRYTQRFRSRFVRTVQICSLPPPLRLLTMRKRLVFEDVNADFGIKKRRKMSYLYVVESVIDKIRKTCYNPTISERNTFLTKSIFFIEKNQIPKGGVCLWVYRNPVYLCWAKKKPSPSSVCSMNSFTPLNFVPAS